MAKPATSARSASARPASSSSTSSRSNSARPATARPARSDAKHSKYEISHTGTDLFLKDLEICYENYRKSKEQGPAENELMELMDIFEQGSLLFKDVMASKNFKVLKASLHLVLIQRIRHIIAKVTRSSEDSKNNRLSTLLNVMESLHDKLAHGEKGPADTNTETKYPVSFVADIISCPVACRHLYCPPDSLICQRASKELDPVIWNKVADEIRALNHFKETPSQFLISIQPYLGEKSASLVKALEQYVRRPMWSPLQCTKLAPLDMVTPLIDKHILKDASSIRNAIDQIHASLCPHVEALGYCVVKHEVAKCYALMWRSDRREVAEAAFSMAPDEEPEIHQYRRESSHSGGKNPVPSQAPVAYLSPQRPVSVSRRVSTASPRNLRPP